MSLRDHALAELKAAGYPLDPGAPEGPDKWMAQGALALIDLFAAQGHSGSSAPLMIELFRKLANFEPITPLTGADDEWVEIGDGTFQNKRCCTIFKEGKDGVAYNIEGVVFEDAKGGRYTNAESRIAVYFPHTVTEPIIRRKD